jgi:hypothetical protein
MTMINLIMMNIQVWWSFITRWRIRFWCTRIFRRRWGLPSISWCYRIWPCLQQTPWTINNIRSCFLPNTYSWSRRRPHPQFTSGRTVPCFLSRPEESSKGNVQSYGIGGFSLTIPNIYLTKKSLHSIQSWDVCNNTMVVWQVALLLLNQ